MDAPSPHATPDELPQRPSLEATLPAASAPRSDATPPAAAASGALPPALAPTLDSRSASGPAQAPTSPAPPAASAGASSSGSSFVAPVPVCDRYEFLCLLGRGGMGAVYKARDRQLGRIVALKFLHGDNPAQVQRFLQEARAQARLDHPHICKVHEVGTIDGKPYIAMQFVDGVPLELASRGMTLFEKVQVLKATAEAMHAAHEQGIVHRDLKPSEVTTERAGPDIVPS